MFNLQRPFYGWIIVGVSFLIGITEAGVFQNILSIFMKPMVYDFGWSRATVTGSIAFGSICGGLVSPVVGPILDRYGPRMVAFWGIFFFSIGLVAMMFLSHIWQLYLFFGVSRMIAVGVLSMVISVSVSNWFIRLRGRAMGIMWIGDRLGSALLPVMIQYLILAQGWRMAWGTLGVVVFLMSGIPSLLFLRRRPEDLGLLPDGAAPVLDKKGEGDPSKKKDRADASGSDLEPVWTRAQATHTKAFWKLTFLNSLIPFLQAGINFHIYPFLTDQGLSEATAVLILSTIAVFGAVGSLTWGIFAEKFRIQGLLSVNLFGNALIFLSLYWAVKFKFVDVLGTGTIFFLAALHGILHGGRNTVLSMIWAEFFGRHSLGSIYSLSSPFRYTANAAGPVFAALCFDLFGSYAFPFYFFVAIFIVSGTFCIYMQPPKSPSQVPIS